MIPAALPQEAQVSPVPRMEGTTGRSMWLGVLRGPLVIAVLFAIVLSVGSSFDIYVAGSIAIYGLASAGISMNPGPGSSLMNPGRAASVTAAVVLVIGLIIIERLYRTQAGREWASVKENEIASAAMGIRVQRRKIQAFVGSSVVTAVAGGLFAYYIGLGMDLTRPESLDVLARITEQSDVVLTNALPEASARLGIDYATVAARNPATCHISILGFGRRPPFGGRRVVDAAAQALSGQALAEGGGREPAGCTGGFLDNGTGWLAALGCVATLYQRQAAGHAGSVEACLLNTSAFVQLFGLTDPPSPGGRLDEDRWGYAADQRLYQARDGWICVAAASPTARQAFAAALALAGCAPPIPGAGREVHGLTAAAFAEALAELDIAAVADLFGRAGFADWTTVRTLEQTARADDDDFVRVAQEPWGFLRQPRLLGRYGLAGRHDALIASGAMRREPGPVTLQASSV